MIAEIFAILGRALEGSPALALGAACVWGVLSILLSPCHLASIPLIVAVIGRQAGSSPRQAPLIAGLFAAGILLSIAVIGGLTALAGRMLGDLGSWADHLVAAMLVAVGLHLWDALPGPWTAPGRPAPSRQPPWLAAFMLGLIFGIALGPCTFAFMAPVLAITFSLSGTQAWYGVLLLMMYAIGHCAVIVLAGSATGWVQRYLDWSAQARSATWIKRACGSLAILAGLYLIWNAP